MTTNSWSSPVDHTTDAGFRTWGSELNSKFAAVGMTQTADTGQIDWTTVTLPTGNTIAGYEIWELSGGFITLRIMYGTANAAAMPEIQIQVGNGSDGSGNLTGTISGNTSIHNFNAQGMASTTTNYQSYLCATADYMMLSWKISGVSTGLIGDVPTCVFMVMQTVDSTGAATSSGYLYYSGNRGGGFFQSISVAANVTGPGQTGIQNATTMVFGAATGAPGSSQDGSGNNQAFLWWHCVLGSTPVTPLLHGATILSVDLLTGTTASLTLVGTTAHTYIAAGSSSHEINAGLPAQQGIKWLALWE